jgi:hypothetical protein
MAYVNKYSQNGEEAHILHYLDTIGLKTGHLVDLGAGDGRTMSNTRALLERRPCSRCHGTGNAFGEDTVAGVLMTGPEECALCEGSGLLEPWTGDLYDGDPKGAKDVNKLWIDVDAVVDTVCVCYVQFLNLDIDGNDYWILDAVLNNCAEDPALIVCEINPIFQRDEAVVMPYNEAHVWDGTTYYGMSLAAAERLGNEYGYTLAYLHAGINAFLIRDIHAQAHPELIRPIEYRVKRDHAPHNPSKQWTTLS